MKLRNSLSMLSLAAVIGTLFANGTPVLAQEKGGLDETGPYQAQAGWFYRK